MRTLEAENYASGLKQLGPQAGLVDVLQVSLCLQ